MKIQLICDIPELLQALGSGIELCLGHYFVPLTVWHMCQPGWSCDAGLLQSERPGEHTVVCIPNSQLDAGFRLMTADNSQWAPLDPKLLFWNERELGPCPNTFSFYCLETHQKLAETAKELVKILEPELVVAGKVDSRRSEYIAQNVYQWLRLSLAGQSAAKKRSP